MRAIHREPVMVQRYLPEVRQGDKRIILVEGEPVGAVIRVPPEGEARANLHVGGRAEKTELTAREREICAAIGPTLREQGLVFVGIDVIGDYMTEINVTSPTGIQEIARLDGIDLAVNIWDAIEARHAERAPDRPSCCQLSEEADHARCFRFRSAAARPAAQCVRRAARRMLHEADDRVLPQRQLRDRPRGFRRAHGLRPGRCRVSRVLESRRQRSVDPGPAAGFSGLKPGDCWCLCAARWKEAFEAGKAPKVRLAATHEATLEIVPLDLLKKHALDLS